MIEILIMLAAPSSFSVHVLRLDGPSINGAPTHAGRDEFPANGDVYTQKNFLRQRYLAATKIYRETPTTATF
jgi:hypothetical protein